MTKTTLMTDYGIPQNLLAFVDSARMADRDNIAASDVRKRPAYVQADFTRDREYIGYTIYVRVGDSHRAFEVRGGTTHFFFVPFSEFVLMPNGANELEAIARASAACGPFDSYSSACQSAQVLASQQALLQRLPRWDRDPNNVVTI
jgi:hypothetical protein